MTPWHDVGEPDDFPDGASWPVRVADREVVVFRLGDELHALADRCTHGNALLSEGYIEDGCVECPLHASKFRLSDGAVLSPPAPAGIAAHSVHVDGDDIVLVPNPDRLA